MGKIPSTQTAAHGMIANGSAADRTIITARAQSSGRGRGSHKWVSHPGNLYASFIFKMHVRPAAPYAIAVAAAEALNALGIPARIKWPNDLLCGSAKISGMLSEYSGGFLVIGIGVNIKVKPAVEYATAKTDDFVPGLLPTDVLAVLMKKFDEWLEADLDAAKKRWNELAGLL